MAFELKAGDECALANDFKVEGRKAFGQGDIVKIIEISPDRLQPGNKYLVESSILSEQLRLPGMVLVRVSCPRCGKRLAQTGPTTYKDACPCGWKDLESQHYKRVAEIAAATAQQAGQALGPTNTGFVSNAASTWMDARDMGKHDTSHYVCPQCGAQLLGDTTDCPACGWRYTSAAQAGPRRGLIKKDIVIEGILAFKAGEQVEVEEESPDLARPDYKYVVLSRAMTRRFRLSDLDLTI